MQARNGLRQHYYLLAWWGMTFGKRLAQAREHRELSQQQLAERLSSGQSTIAKWELDEREPRNLVMMATKAAEVLDVSLPWLLHGQGHMTDSLIVDAKKSGIVDSTEGGGAASPGRDGVESAQAKLIIRLLRGMPADTALAVIEKAISLIDTEAADRPTRRA